VAGSLANPLFYHRDPLLQLRDADQELLLAALEGLTDEELCAKLNLSVTAIKKRWISIFERTIYTRPDLFPAVDCQNDGQKRGRQKRHHVLAYVRAHPEELRLTEPRVL
jgi:DNA-binding NarL/FixJ family response regulator